MAKGFYKGLILLFILVSMDCQQLVKRESTASWRGDDDADCKSIDHMGEFFSCFVHIIYISTIQ